MYVNGVIQNIDMDIPLAAIPTRDVVLKECHEFQAALRRSRELKARVESLNIL
jgi:hypothetical protein